MSDVSDAEAASEPGVLRRVAAGAWHVPAGFVFLLRRPSLWPLALLPAVMAVVLVCGGAIAGIYAGPYLEAAVAPRLAWLPEWLSVLVALGLWVAALVTGAALGLATALLAAAPVLERLSVAVEALVRPSAAPPPATSLGWQLAQSFRTATYFLLATPGILLLGLVPLAGPLLGAAWGAYALALQETEPALARRGVDFAARRAWHRRWRAESMGFGLAGLLVLGIPCVNFLLAPALVVGGTLLVNELVFEQGGAAAHPPEPPAPSRE